MLENSLKVIVSAISMFLTTKFLFLIFPMEMTKPNHDMILILVGFIVGVFVYYGLEEFITKIKIIRRQKLWHD
jgi:hypothetical protein